jgi:very-short-patch-repair endonuclease
VAGSSPVWSTKISGDILFLREIADSYKGDKNSQFGTAWIHKGGDVKKINASDIDEYLKNGWARGRITPRTPEENKARMQVAYDKRTRFDHVCANCGNPFKGKLYQKNCSKECSKWQSGKNAAATMKANGTNSGWHTRKGEASYPEKYFEELFRKEQISGWAREKKIGRWFIDFAFENKKIALEIDGRQHDDTDRANSDKIKDEFLASNGWKVIRIRWSNPTTEAGKEKLYAQIEKVLSVLR